MRNKAITQIILVVVSVIIIVTYIKPTFKDMENISTEADEYKTALENAASYDAALQDLYARANSFSVSERRALERFLPVKVDRISVMRDIETIVENHAMSLKVLASESEGHAINTNDEVPVQGQSAQDKMPVNVQQFTLSVSGTYEQFKSLLQDFERNAYPLEVASLTVVVNGEGLYDFNLTLETYSLVSGE